MPVGTAYSAADIFADEHMVERGDLVAVADPVIGPVRQQAPFPRLVGEPVAVPAGAPRLGEHTDEVFGELLGLDPATLDISAGRGCDLRAMDLPFRPVDGDHHYYEARDAFTRHLDPAMAKRCVQWAEIGGRQRILVGGKFDRFAEAACRFVVVDWSIRAREGRPGYHCPAPRPCAADAVAPLSISTTSPVTAPGRRHGGPTLRGREPIDAADRPSSAGQWRRDRHRRRGRSPIRSRGARVVVTGRRPGPIEELASTIDGRAVTGDTRHADHAAAAVATAVREFGGLDIVVASAGIDRGDAIGDLDDEDWELTLAVNLTGPMVMVRAALPALLARDHASVVLVSSVNGLANAPASAAYDASKAGLISLARSIAVDYGPRGVRAERGLPGWVRTPMGDEDMDAVAAAHGVSREEAYDLVTRHLPLRRAAAPEDIADCCLFLASDDSAYVTGAAIPVDGGGLAVDISSTAFAEGVEPMPPARTRPSPRATPAGTGGSGWGS